MDTKPTTLDLGPAAISRAVHATLDEATAALPAGKNHAVLIDATGPTQAQVLFVQRAPKGWQVVLQGDWEGNLHVSGKVTAMKAW